MGAAAEGIGLGLEILSGLMGYFGAQQQGQATQDYNNFMADQMNQQADYTEQLADIQVNDLKNQVGKVDAQQKVGQAANGIYSNSGSAEAVARDTITQGKLDELAIRYNADIQAQNYRLQAKGYKMAGSNAVSAGNTNAAGSLIGAAGGVADRWYRWSQTSQGNNNNNGYGGDYTGGNRFVPV